MSETIVIGAGPAGLTAAYELSKLGHRSAVIESDNVVGGISRTVSYNNFRFDIGGHRFFSKIKLINDLWREILGEDFLQRPRMSRIYYRNRFFDYPLRAMNALSGLGPLESARCVLSYAAARLFPKKDPQNFEDWVANRFGHRLYSIFFKTYTEKVWGIPCHEISADWAAQRIKNLSLSEAIRNALLPRRGPATTKDGQIITTLIDTFHYPRFGPGQMWERCEKLLAERGHPVIRRVSIDRVRMEGNRVACVYGRGPDGGVTEFAGRNFISSMPLRELILAMDPPPPEEVLRAARRLRYRDYLTVVLIINRPELFPDNWIYIHSPDVKVGRVQNYKSWSPDMVPDPGKCSLGLEYFLWDRDEEWDWPDARLVELGIAECEKLRLIERRDVADGTVVRMRKAYPIYDRDYRETLDVLIRFVNSIENLQAVGRNGQHRYNNQDHSMLTGVFAARNIAGARYDVWGVNVEQEYHEETRGAAAEAASGASALGEVRSMPVDRLVPARVPTAAETDASGSRRAV